MQYSEDKLKKKILFLCTENSCRSQMAEGLAKALKSSKFDFYSAGIKKKYVNPYAIKILKEINIDISTQSSKLIKELPNTNFDYVITVCSNADQNCPVFQGDTKVIHHGFEDPSKLINENMSEEERLKLFRKTRDEIKAFIENIKSYI